MKKAFSGFISSYFSRTYLYLLVLSIFIFSCEKKTEIDYANWAHYGGPEDGSRYSGLTQITKENVAQLQVAWTYNTGDATERSQIQCQPIVINGLLYATTPKLNVFALDAATGEEVWRFDPFEVLGGENSWAGTNRGVSYWEEGEDKRILFSAGHWLMAVNALTGDGSKQNSMDTKTAAGLQPDVAARQMVRAISNHKLEVYIGKVETWAIYLKRILPSLFAKVLAKAKVT